MSTLTQTTLELKVNYDRSIEELVRAGKYDYANSDVVSQNFPSQRRGQANLEAALVQFDRYLESEEVLAELGKMGLRAGELHELLALGAQHPDEQRHNPIVALGSVWRGPGGGRHVACLWSRGSERRLLLYWFGGGWGDDYRFLAFRK